MAPQVIPGNIHRRNTLTLSNRHSKLCRVPNSLVLFRDTVTQDQALIWILACTCCYGNSERITVTTLFIIPHCCYSTMSLAAATRNSPLDQIKGLFTLEAESGKRNFRAAFPRYNFHSIYDSEKVEIFQLFRL